MLTPGADPVRKISIIPRTMSLGVTISAPGSDRFNYDKQSLLAHIKVATGGRAAEEVVYGDETTGAESDIRQATQLARNMVGRFGMSDAIGFLSVLPQDGDGSALMPGVSEVSERTRQRIDDEMRRIVGDAHDEAVQLLADNRERLDSLAEALFQAETLEGPEAYAAAGLATAPTRRRPSPRRSRTRRIAMLPLSDGLHPRRFPIVNVALIAANFAVWMLYELPHLNSAVYHASFYPCTVDNACHGPEPWGISWFTSMFMHGSWDHILGNMLFLAIFGKNVEDAFGHLRYLAFYVAGGFVATMTQTAVTLLFGTAAAARVPNLGASGAIAAVLGAFFVLYPDRAHPHAAGIFFVQDPGLGLPRPAGSSTSSSRANFGLASASANGGGVAFFAHVGGFVFGVVVARGPAQRRPRSCRRARRGGPRCAPF